MCALPCRTTLHNQRASAPYIECGLINDYVDAAWVPTHEISKKTLAFGMIVEGFVEVLVEFQRQRARLVSLVPGISSIGLASARPDD